MGNYCGPKVRLTRALGVPISESNKHMRLRRENPPGMHTFRRRRKSLYGRQLQEKQKLMFYYNVRDAQMRKYLTAAARDKRSTPEVLHEMLETRLDNVVRRLGWASTIWQARQMVSHGHFMINGRKVDRPSQNVRPDDVLTVKERSKQFVKFCSEQSEYHLVLDWIERDDDKLEARFTRMPTPEDSRIPFDIDYALIIEYYTK